MPEFLGWVVGSYLVACYAASTGRDKMKWCLLSLFFSPLMALIVLVVMNLFRGSRGNEG